MLTSQCRQPRLAATGCFPKMTFLIQLLGIYGIGMGIYVINKREVRYGWRGRPASGSIVGIPAIIVGVLLVALGICMLSRPEVFATRWHGHS